MKHAKPEHVKPLRRKGMSYPAIAKRLAKQGLKNLAGRTLTAQNVRRLHGANARATSFETIKEVVDAKLDDLRAAPKPPKRMTGRMSWQDVPEELRDAVVREIADRLVGGGK